MATYTASCWPLTGDGFSYAELKEYADLLQRELLLVKTLPAWRPGAFNANASTSRFPRRLAELGIHPQQIIETLSVKTRCSTPARSTPGRADRVAPSGTFESVEEIGNLVIRSGSPVESAIRAALPPQLTGYGSTSPELVLLRDVATITRGYLDPPYEMMRFNGRPAIGLAISTVANGNVADDGRCGPKAAERIDRAVSHRD